MARDLSVDGQKLDNIAAGAEVNVQSDWNATSGDALILNKPTIPAAQVQSDWNASSEGDPTDSGTSPPFLLVILLMTLHPNLVVI